MSRRPCLTLCPSTRSPSPGPTAVSIDTIPIALPRYCALAPYLASLIAVTSAALCAAPLAAGAALRAAPLALARPLHVDAAGADATADTPGARSAISLPVSR